MLEDIPQVAKAISHWMLRMTQKAGAKGGLFGVSGGLDSALLVALAKKAWKHDCLGLVLPCHSAKSDVEDALTVLNHFDCKYKILDLTPVFDAFTSILDGPTDFPFMARANLKPRLRMAALYYYANAMNYLVTGTTNKSEYFVGYFTKYGDGGVDLLPLAGLTKSEVKRLSAYLKVPNRIREKVPSGGLWEGQTDEKEMGITYADLDAYLLKGQVPSHAQEKILNMHKNSEHKRNLPPIPFLGTGGPREE